MHRQIGIHTEKRLLKRKNEQTLREGHAHGHARHASEPAGGFSTADRYSAVLNRKVVQKYGRAEKRHRPSALLFALLSEACAAKLVQGRGDPLFDVVVRGWCWNEASEYSEVCARMTYSHTMQHGQRDKRMSSQSWNGSGALTQWILWAL